MRDRIIRETTAAFFACAIRGICRETSELSRALVGDNAFLIVVARLIAKVTLFARATTALAFSFLDFLAIYNSADAVERINCIKPPRSFDNQNAAIG